MSVIGPFSDETGIMIREDLSGNNAFKTVAYGLAETAMERWWLYAPGGSTALDYRSPGFARPSQVAQFRFAAAWNLKGWKKLLATDHSATADHSAGHPDDPIPHAGQTDFAYVKGTRAVLDTLPATVTAMNNAAPHPPTPTDCPNGSPEVDPCFLRIRPLGGGSDLGYVYTYNITGTGAPMKVELWMLINDATFPRPSSSVAGFEVIQRSGVTGPSTLDQSVINFFANAWVANQSSLTIVKTRWYSCKLPDADL